MKRWVMYLSLFGSLSGAPALAQGVPTFDNAQLGQLVMQLEHMAEDLNVQLEQLATMRQELETQLNQLLNLEAQLTALVDGNELGQLFATVEEFERVRGKLTAPLETCLLYTSDAADD